MPPVDERVPAREPECDGRRLLAALAAAVAWLEQHRASVDALNVFPVPDGDTGTNMSLTLSAALREAEASPAHEAGAIAERATYGALMGARGNSGVILSQLMRGFARALRGRRQLGRSELAEALAAAAETAKRAVVKPVEGTILTVAASSARAAEDAAARDGDLGDVLAAALEEARAAVARTPDQLPILKQAGVVDAGAQGYLLILEGASRYLHGQRTDSEPAATDHGSPHTTRVAHARVSRGDDYGYCTEFVVVGPGLDELAIRDAIAALGDSTLVVGLEGVVRVHVHTEDPGRVLSYAAPLGRLHRVKIESMQEQHDHFVAQSASPSPPVPLSSAPERGGQAPSSQSPLSATKERAEPALDATAATAGCRLPATLPFGSSATSVAGVVAVAPGEGLADVFQSLGAGAVVLGGQTMNPSTEELLAAIDTLPQEAVLLLPNNDNVTLVAAQTRELSRKAVSVVPTHTMPQGIAAMVAYLPDADVESNAAAMEEAAAGVRTGEVTVAVRDAQIDGLVVRAGDALGLLDGQAVLAHPERDGAALELMERMDTSDAEVLTIYYGKDVQEAEARALASRARERFGDCDVELVDGGQPHYPYIMSVE